MSSFLFVKRYSHRILLFAMQGNGGVHAKRRQFQINQNRKSRNKHPWESNYALGAGSLHPRHTDKRATDDHLEPSQGMRGGNDILTQ